MAFCLENSSDEEQRVMIRFLIAENNMPFGIHYRMIAVYSEDCMPRNECRYCVLQLVRKRITHVILYQMIFSVEILYLRLTSELDGKS